MFCLVTVFSNIHHEWFLPTGTIINVENIRHYTSISAQGFLEILNSDKNTYPKKKYPAPAPTATAKHNQILYVMKISIKK